MRMITLLSHLYIIINNYRFILTFSLERIVMLYTGSYPENIAAFSAYQNYNLIKFKTMLKQALLGEFLYEAENTRKLLFYP